MCWLNTSLKMNYLTSLYLSHTLQAIEDLFDPKSSELPTLVEDRCLANLLSLTHS